MNRRQYTTEHKQADIVFQGHDHALGVLPLDAMGFLEDSGTGLQYTERTTWIVGTGSFSQAWRPGEGTYNSARCRGGRALGAPVFEVQLKRPRRNGRITLYPRLRGIVG